MTRVDEVFDEWARAGRAEGMAEGHLRTAGPTLRGLPIEAGTRFLDLGCGNGWAARQAAARGASALGIDASQEMISRARVMSQGTAQFERADFTRLPVDDGDVDIVWSMEAVYYAEDPDAVLKEVARVLRAGGAFHMVIDFYEENEASHGWPDDVGVAMALRSEAAWVAAFEAAGFVDVTSQRLRSDDPAAEDWKRTQGSLHVSGIRSPPPREA